MTTNKQIEKLKDIQNALTDLSETLSMLSWDRKYCEDIHVGEHLFALEMHLNNAVGRTSTLIGSIRTVDRKG